MDIAFIVLISLCGVLLTLCVVLKIIQKISGRKSSSCKKKDKDK